MGAAAFRICEESLIGRLRIPSPSARNTPGSYRAVRISCTSGKKIPGVEGARLFKAFVTNAFGGHIVDGCVFCRIVGGQIPCSRVYETDQVLAFDDIHPMAPVHVIVIPKAHIPTLMDLNDEAAVEWHALLRAVQEVAAIKKIDHRGFRTVINCREEGGQVIFHLHIHVLGGEKLRDELN